MKVNVVTGDITKIETQGMIIGFFEGTKKPAGVIAEIDKALDGAITNLIRTGEITGKPDEIVVIHSFGRIAARVIAVAGLGKEYDFTGDDARSVIGKASRVLRKSSCASICILISLIALKSSMPLIARSCIEGAILGLYSFKKHSSSSTVEKEVNELVLFARNGEHNFHDLRKACEKGKISAEFTNLARDLVNEPANFLTPSDLADLAKKLATELNLNLTVLDQKQMKKEGMEAILGVAQGSAQPPRFILLSYRGNPHSGKTIGFVGKGITFDSGGISIKPSENMKDMKGDMAGAAAVLAAVGAISRLKLKVNVTAIVAATENLPDGKALKPGDVVKAINGKTIEVISTDAEGRLTLADALGYALTFGFSPLLDIATLTGSCHVALGEVCSGVFTNDQSLVDKVIEAGNLAGECMWQMPMRKEYKEENKSDVADMKNSAGRFGGAITAALFLSEFVGTTPWVHIDIAGTATIEKERGCLTRGATGVTVRTLINLVEILAKL